MNDNKFVLGVDACKFGWVVTQLFYNSILKFSLHKNISEIICAYPDFHHLFLDMPIGLPENTFRKCDIEARKILGCKSSSIFSVPIREAVYAPDYKSACEINRAKTDKKFPIQSWCISPKIREVDQYLLTHKSLIFKIYESHPELCFLNLNGGKPLLENKSKLEGVGKRFAIIEKYLPATKNTVTQFLNDTLRKEVLLNDILDSVILAVAAVNANTERRLPVTAEYDPNGIPMNIYY